MERIDFVFRGPDRLRDNPIITIAAEREVDLPPPQLVLGRDLLTPATAESIVRGKQMHFPAIEYCPMEEARIVDQSLIVSRQGEVFFGTMNRNAFLGYLGRFPAQDGERSMRPVAAVRTIRGTALILPVSSPSMSHFLFEGLPYLTGATANIGTVIVTTTPQRGFADLIRLGLGREVEVLFRAPELYDEAWIVECALVPVYRFALHPAMNEVVDAVGAACGGKPAASDLLYISRRDSNRYRMMLNEDRIEKVVSDLGFEVLELFAMEEVDIVKRFRSAKTIIGPLGAGLYNCIFAPPDCTVIALCAPNYLRSLLNQCAALRGVRRVYCLGPDFLSYEPEQAGGNNDFVVDEESVIAAARTALKGAT